MEPEGRAVLEKAIKFKKKLSGLVRSYQYPTEPRSQLLLAYHSIVAEHHAAILLLIENKLHGSAFALVRPLYESLYRGHWILGCATADHIGQIRQGKDIFPRMYDMVSQIDDAFDMGDFFHSIAKNSWGPMNDYTHGGLRQIGRRFIGNVVEPNYGSEELVEVVDGINIALMLMALVFFKAFGKLDAAKEVERMISEYTASEDCIHNKRLHEDHSYTPGL